MKRFLQRLCQSRLCQSRLRSLECMVYAMSLFVILGVVYSLGQLQLQQQFYRGLGHPGHQNPEGRRVLSFFRRSSGDNEDEGDQSSDQGHRGWRDKPFAISHERWRALLHNDIPDNEDKGQTEVRQSSTVLDEIDGYNAFVSVEVIPRIRFAQPSSNNSPPRKLLDRIQAEHSVQSQGQRHEHESQEKQNEGQQYHGHGGEGDHDKILVGQGQKQQNKLVAEDSQLKAKPNGSPGVQVHESFLVHEIRPAYSSQKQMENNLQDEIELEYNENGREIKDSDLDQEFAGQKVNGGQQHFESDNTDSKWAQPKQQLQLLVDRGDKNTEQLNGAGWKLPPKSSKQFIKSHEEAEMSGKKGKRLAHKNPSHSIDNTGVPPEKRKDKVYGGYSRQADDKNNETRSHKKPHLLHQKGILTHHAQNVDGQLSQHDIRRREVRQPRKAGGPMGKDDASTTDGGYGHKTGALESRQMPSWQVLAKIEQDLEAEGHKMQMQMLRFVMHNSTQDTKAGTKGQSLQVNRDKLRQQVVIVPQSSPYQSNAHHNEIVKQQEQQDHLQSQNTYPYARHSGMEAQSKPKDVSTQIKYLNKSKGFNRNHHHHQSHHHSHHHSHHRHNNQDPGANNQQVVAQYLDYSSGKIKTGYSVGGLFNKNNVSESHQLKDDTKLPFKSATQPRIYMAMLGRLGNHLFHLASLYGISRKTNHIPVISPGVYILDAFDDRIKEVFLAEEAPNGITTIHEKGSGVFSPEIYNLPPKDVAICCYFQSWRYFVEYSDELRSIFSFKPWIQTRAQLILSTAKRDYMSMQFGRQLPIHVGHTITYVGVHIRRSDHLLTEHLKKGYKPASLPYFNKAMDYFRQKYANVYFIVCSDEIEWAKQHLRDMDVYFVEGQDGLVDLAVLAACNHTVTSVGTFSWWAGWLAGGEVTYYSDWPTAGTEIDKNYQHFDYFMPHWKPFGD